MDVGDVTRGTREFNKQTTSIDGPDYPRQLSAGNQNHSGRQKRYLITKLNIIDRVAIEHTVVHNIPLD